MCGFNSYSRFCSVMSVSCFPLNEEVLEYYVISISRRVAYQTIKVYLCGIQFFSHLHGWSSVKICDMMRLRYLLRGIRRSLGSSRIRPRRLPITIDHIGQMFSFINHNFNFHDRLMLKSAISLAFFGMLRCSEYTCASPSRFDQLFDLSFRDVRVSTHNIVSIHIKSSKTDPFRKGCVIRISRTFNNICPVICLVDYLNVHSCPLGPLFIFRNGEFLTRNHISSLLRSALPRIANINTHSFRIGGASAAASAGIEDSTIQILGKWTSDAFRRYLHLSDDFILQTFNRMSAIRTLSRCWDTDLASSEASL